jgi:hypothetical protein
VLVEECEGEGGGGGGGQDSQERTLIGKVSLF